MSGLRAQAAVCALVIGMLGLVACSAGSDEADTSSTEPQSTTTTQVLDDVTRDPYFWPHSSESVWNKGLGSEAQLAPDDNPATMSLRGNNSDASPAGISYREFTHPISLASSSDPSVELQLEDVYADGDVTCFVNRGNGGNSRQSCDQSVPSVEINMPDGLEADPGNCSPEVPGPICSDGENTDGSLHVVQPDGKTIYSMFRAFGAGSNWRAARVAVWDLTNDGIAAEPDQQWGTRAYGGSDVAGLMRCWELEKIVSGEWTAFPHALALAVHGSQLKAGSTQEETFVWPATTSDSGWPSYTGNVPMGALVAVDRDAVVSTSSKVAAAILETLKIYGGFVVDQTGGQFAAYAEPGCEMNEVLTRAGYAMPQIQSVATVVTNNGPDSINGGGNYPPLAPDLEPKLGEPLSGAYFPPIS